MNDQVRDYTKIRAVRSMQKAVAAGQTVTMKQVAEDLDLSVHALRDAVGDLESLYGLLLGPSFGRLLKTRMNAYRKDALKALEDFPEAQIKLMTDIPPIG